jgi:hypothetical protein
VYVAVVGFGYGNRVEDGHFAYSVVDGGSAVVFGRPGSVVKGREACRQSRL